MSVVFGFEAFDERLEHPRPLVEHLKLGHEAHRQRIVRIYRSKLLLLLLLALQRQDVGLKVGYLRVGSATQGGGHGCIDVLELLLVSDGQDALAELDCTFERLHLVVALKTLHDRRHHTVHAQTEGLLVVRIEPLERYQVLEDRADQLLFVLQLAYVVKARLDALGRDGSKRVHTDCHRCQLLTLQTLLVL